MSRISNDVYGFDLDDGLLFLGGCHSNDFYAGDEVTALSWKVRTGRERQGLTQAQLGARLGFTNGQMISNIERGLCDVPVAKLKLLAKYLAIDKRELVEAYADDAREHARKAIGLKA